MTFQNYLHCLSLNLHSLFMSSYTYLLCCIAVGHTPHLHLDCSRSHGRRFPTLRYDRTPLSPQTVSSHWPVSPPHSHTQENELWGGGTTLGLYTSLCAQDNHSLSPVYWWYCMVWSQLFSSSGFVCNTYYSTPTTHCILPHLATRHWYCEPRWVTKLTW